MSAQARSETVRAGVAGVAAPSRGAARRIGVIIVDPLHVVRAGLRLLIDAEKGMEVLAEADSADGGLVAVTRLRRRTRVVVLVGLGLGGDHDSYWLIRTLRESYPSLSILGCGANADPAGVSRALFVGADGFVDKNVELPKFLGSVREAAEGEMVLAGPPIGWLGSIADGVDRQRDAAAILTQREREVLAVAAEGLTAKQIASRLGVRERTITTHLGRIYAKLGVGSRVAAIRTALRSGLVSVGAAE